MEIMVAAAVGAIAIAGAFAFAKYQITSYRTQGEIANMNSGANIVFEAMIRDIRSAAFGSSFYAGATPQAFNGRLVLLDGAVAQARGRLLLRHSLQARAVAGPDCAPVKRLPVLLNGERGASERQKERTGKEKQRRNKWSESH